MSVYRFASNVSGPLFAIAAAITLAAPGFSQIQPTDTTIQRVRPGTPTVEPVRSPQIAPQMPMVLTPLDPTTADGDLPADDPWVTFCLITSEPGEDLANCLDGLP